MTNTNTVGAMMTDPIRQLADAHCHSTNEDMTSIWYIEDVMAFARALLSASKPAAPMGWKLVPVELMQPMRDAFFADGGIERVDWLTKGYAAMLAASPAAPAQSAEPANNASREANVRDRARWFVRDFSRDVGFAMSDAQQEVMLNLFLRYAAPHPSQPAQSGESVVNAQAPTLWEAFEMGFSLRSAMLGHVLDGRDVGRLTTCEFWHPSMLGMHEGNDLHVGLSVSEAIVKVKNEVRRRLDAFDTARSAPSAVVLDDERAALDIKCIPKMPEHVLADLQSATTYLEMWAKGEALYAPKNGYDEPSIKTATITDVKKSAKYLAPRMREASFALQDYFMAIDQARAASPQATATQPAQTTQSGDAEFHEAVVKLVNDMLDAWQGNVPYLQASSGLHARVNALFTAPKPAAQPAQTERALTCCRMGCDKPSVCERLGECRIKAAAQPASGGE